MIHAAYDLAAYLPGWREAAVGVDTLTHGIEAFVSGELDTRFLDSESDALRATIEDEPPPEDPEVPRPREDACGPRRESRPKIPTVAPRPRGPKMALTGRDEVADEQEMRAFWDEKAADNPLWYVHSGLDFEEPDEAEVAAAPFYDPAGERQRPAA